MSAQEALEETRRLVLLLKHLKHVLRQKNGNFADKDLCKALNKVAGDTIYSPASFSRLVKPDVWPKAELRRKLLDAIYLLARTNDPAIEFDMQAIAAEYMSELPEQLRLFEEPKTTTPRAHQGQALGETARVLMGAWRQFYLVPSGASGDRKYIVRCTIAAYLPAAADDRSITTRFIGSREQWDAVTYVNDTHMYTVSTTPERSEVSLILSNKPMTRETLTAGLCVSLERPSAHTVRPALGIVTFAEKIEPGQHTTVDGVSDDLIDHFARGEEITADEEANLRGAFFVQINSLEELKRRHSAIRDYLKKLTLNDKAFSAQSLLLKWK